MQGVKEQVLKVLERVEDPELGLDIVNLGLIYDVKVDEDSREIRVLMTLTSPFCPLARLLYASAVQELTRSFPDWKVSVELTFDPPWTPERITPKGREILKQRFGFDVVEEWIRRMRGSE